MNFHHSFLTPDYRVRLLATIQANGDIDLIETYEIMNMPVIKLQQEMMPPQPQIRLKLFYHSGTHWQTYIVNF